MIRVFLWTESLKAKFSGEEGAGLAEYALLLFVIAVAAAGIITTFGGNVINAFTDASNELPASSP
ncbi:MAG: Flp family type IVb pilin [Actinomycetota bacterium]